MAGVRQNTTFRGGVGQEVSAVLEVEHAPGVLVFSVS